MEVNLGQILQKMGLFQMAIAGTLVLMAIASLAVFFERLYTFTRSRKASLDFAPLAAKLLDAGDYKALIKLAEDHKSSQLASLLAAGTQSFLAGKAKPGKLGAIELARRELARQSDSIAAEI